MTQYEGIGIVENDGQFENEKLERFSSAIDKLNYVAYGQKRSCRFIL